MKKGLLIIKGAGYACSFLLLLVYTHIAYASDMLAYLANHSDRMLLAEQNSDVRYSVVQIYASDNYPHYINSWMTVPSNKHRGTGFIIEGNMILTSAHVIADQSVVHVRKYGKSTRHRARVIYIAHTSDLAILKVNEPDFFKNITPLSIGEMPTIGNKVLLYGYPGGETLITSNGILTNIAKQTYLYSNHVLPAGKIINASIKPGHSGGPVVMGGEVIGVIMQTSKSGDSSLIIPGPVIKNMLTAFEAIIDNYPYASVALPIQSDDKDNTEAINKVPLRYLSFL